MGYLRIRDKGKVGEQEQSKITGRIKEIFKTFNGKYVSSALIEAKFISHEMVNLACMGWSSYLIPHCLMQLSEDTKEKVTSGGDAAKAAMEKEKEIEIYLKAVNREVDDHEIFQFVFWIKEVWLPEIRLLTSTQKIIRKKIEVNYEETNDTWYGAKKAVIWHGW